MHPTSGEPQQANPGYALGQLAKALFTAENNPDPETRARAEKKSQDWRNILDGMLSGHLNIGSRTPLGNTPAWATLEVTGGGFTTGQLLAAGDLLPHEQTLLRQIGPVEPGTERAALNTYFLTDEGLRTLQSMLKSGCYRIQVPEEGALLAVAWLLEHGQPEAARSILGEIRPFLDWLRFYPVPDPLPLTSSTVVRLQSVGQTAAALQNLQIPDRVARERESIQVWAPLYDRFVNLLLETVEGPPPSVVLDANGQPVRDSHQHFVTEGGIPGRQFPEDWSARAQAALDDYQQLSQRYPLSRRHKRGGGGFHHLRSALEACLQDPQKLTERERLHVRGILAAYIRRWGLPGTELHTQRQQQHAEQGRAATRVQFARVVAERLGRLPADSGLTELEQVLQPATGEEAQKNGLREGRAITPSMARRIRLSLEAPTETLVQKGIIRSGETLATVIPQITAQIRSAGIQDPALRQLFGAIYTAFRRRRSLLLLNLQSQVRLEELPWVAALQSQRKDGLEQREQARQTLEQVALLTVESFPHQIVPNKLLTEIRALSDSAGLALPLVEELAADIFQGSLTEKFLRAAQRAGDLLESSLYERYYGIPYETLRQISDGAVSPQGPRTSEALIRLCTERAGEAGPQPRYSVARNGKILEQLQILTTQNLAVLFDGLQLTQTLSPRLPEMARRCFEWICARQQMKIDRRKSQLQMLKNTAYAWRQMMFYLSLIPNEEVELFLAWAIQHLGQQKPKFRRRFSPILGGLAMAEHGGSLDEAQKAGLHKEVRRFLGWTTEKHWLLADEAPSEGVQPPA